jgi:hypothetical protein
MKPSRSATGPDPACQIPAPKRSLHPAQAAEIRHELVPQAMIQPRLSRFVSNSEPKAMNTIPEASSNEARCLRAAEAKRCACRPWPGSYIAPSRLSAGPWPAGLK